MSIQKTGRIREIGRDVLDAMKSVATTFRHRPLASSLVVLGAVGLLRLGTGCAPDYELGDPAAGAKADATQLAGDATTTEDSVSRRPGPDAVGGETADASAATCADKEAKGTKTYYTVNLNGKKEKIQDGDTVQEKGQKYKVTVTGGSVVLKAVGEDGSEKPYKVTVNGKDYVVANGDSLTDSFGATWTVNVTTDSDGKLTATLTNGQGVKKSVDAVGSSDATKEATPFTTTYYQKKYVLSVSGLKVTESEGDNRVVVTSESGEMSYTGFAGTAVKLWFTGETDAFGNPLLAYTYTAANGTTGTGQVGLKQGAQVVAGEVAVTVELEGQAVHGDSACKVSSATMTVTGPESGTYTVPEGAAVPITSSGTVLTVSDAVADGSGPFCVSFKLETPQGDSGISAARVVCNGDKQPGLTRTIDGKPNEVQPTGVVVEPGPEAKQ